MTPFDPVALLAMLVTFYPAPSPANLIRARAERPEYFAGGILIGRGPDAIRLPDGRIFDLIFNWDGPGEKRWQVIEPGGAGGEVEAFPLEPGYLDPIDPVTFPALAYTPAFEPLAAGAIGQLGNVDSQFAGPEARIAAASSPAGFLAGHGATVPRARGETEAQLAAIGALDVTGIVTATEGQGGEIGAREGDYPDPAEAPAFMVPIDAGEAPPEEPPEPPEV